ncbi:MAG: sigma-70 family RNA polymerase sigma factor [Pseudomonadota bacterium]
MGMMLEQRSPQLLGLAYRMLGSMADAEDVVQDAWIRLHQTQPKPASEQAFLYRIVSNLCIDRLRRLKVERRHYFGPWLPEPVADASLDLEDAAIAAQDLSTGFLLLIEKLSPAERIVYVLRQAFDFSYQEISQILAITPACARQRAHRAQQRLREAALDAPPEVVQKASQKSMLTELATRVAAADIDGVIKLLSDDVVALTDGGGVVSAAIIPVTGRQRIAQMAVFLHRKHAAAERSSLFSRVNGGWSMVDVEQGALQACLQIETDGALIRRIYVVRNPAKLKNLSVSLGLRLPEQL